jgi:hypothetical protein
MRHFTVLHLFQVVRYYHVTPRDALMPQYVAIAA